MGDTTPDPLALRGTSRQSTPATLPRAGVLSPDGPGTPLARRFPGSRGGDGNGPGRTPGLAPRTRAAAATRPIPRRLHRLLLLPPPRRGGAVTSQAGAGRPGAAVRAGGAGSGGVRPDRTGPGRALRALVRPRHGSLRADCRPAVSTVALPPSAPPPVPSLPLSFLSPPPAASAGPGRAVTSAEFPPPPRWGGPLRARGSLRANGLLSVSQGQARLARGGGAAVRREGAGAGW